VGNRALEQFRRGKVMADDGLQVTALVFVHGVQVR